MGSTALILLSFYGIMKQLILLKDRLPKFRVIPLPCVASERQFMVIQFKQILRVRFKGERYRLRSFWNSKKFAPWSDKQAPEQILVYIDIKMQIFINEGMIVFDVPVGI